MDYVLAKRKAVLLIQIPTKDGFLKRVSATGKPEKGVLPATKDLPSQDVVYPAITQEEIKYLIDKEHPHARLFKPASAMPEVVNKTIPAADAKNTVK